MGEPGVSGNGNNDAAHPDHISWHNIIFNPTILDCILEHLSLPDIKRLRTTCKQLNKLILTRKRFTNGSVYVVCETNIPTKENSGINPAFRTVDILENTEVKWKNVKIVLYNDFFKIHQKMEKDHLTELIRKDVGHLTIVGTKKFMKTSCILFLMEEWQIPNCTHLTHLSMEFNLLNALLISGFAFLTDNMKQIDILESKFKSDKGDDYDILTANLELIAQKCRKLEKFTIKNGYAPLMNKPEVKKQLLNILNNNAETLTSIEWLCDPIVESNEFEALKMPKLKEVQAYCSKESLTINNFARNQVNLEKLSVVFFKKLNSYPIDQILQTMIKFKKTLKSFTVTFCSLDTTNWDALKEMEVLNAFNIFGMQNEGGVQHFTSFPRTLKTLVLREITMNDNFYTDLWMSSFPFESMTTLCLMGCKPSLTDRDIQEIIRRMTNLNVLMIQGAPKVTDKGFIIDNSGIPLSHLKGIRELTLTMFPRITKNIHSALQFQNLRKLELRDNYSLHLTEDLLASLIVQNPQLEKISFSQCSLPKYKRGGFAPLQNFANVRSSGRCRLIEDMEKEEPSEFEADNDEESELDSEENLVLTAEEDEYEDENECLDEEEDEDSNEEY